MASDLNITVGGTPLSFIASWGDPVITHRWPYGSWELTWNMRLPYGFRHTDLNVGADVCAFVGPSRVWRGVLSEPNMDTLEFVAYGSARAADTAQALTSGGNPTTVPNTAIDQANARGAIPFARAGLWPISATAFVTDDETDHFNSVTALMDAYSESVSKRWWVDVDNYARLDADPTTPSLMVTPGAGILGVADEDYVTHLYGTYLVKRRKFDHVTASDTTQDVGRIERRVDLTGLGVISQAKAQAVLDGMLAKGVARTGWTNGLEVGFGEVLTMGGTPVALSDVRAGAMVELTGLYDQRGDSASTDIILAETVWNVRDGLLKMNPVGLAARDFAKVVESMGGVLA